MADNRNRPRNPNGNGLGRFAFVGGIIFGGIAAFLLSRGAAAGGQTRTQAPSYTFTSCPVVPNNIDTTVSQPIVQAIQESLNFLGYSAGPEDGLWGPQTESAVRSFQQANNITVDGIAGPEFYGTINNRLQVEGGRFVCSQS